jgi:Cysteine-rich secretory protein family
MAPPQLVELGLDQEVLDLINAERIKAGIKPLNDSEPIDDAADRHALDLAKNMNVSETGSDGSTVNSRAKDSGYLFANVGEAIAAGPMDPKAVVSQWLNDPTQRDKLLNPNFTDAGLGIVADTNDKLYWVETFGGPDVAPTPDPAPAPADPITPPVAANPDPMTPPADPMTEPAKKPKKNGGFGGKQKGMKKKDKDLFGDEKEFGDKFKKEFGDKFANNKEFGDKFKKEFGDKFADNKEFGDKFKKEFADKFGGKREFGMNKKGGDLFGDTTVGNAKDFQPSKDPVGNPGNKNRMGMKISFGPKDMNKFDDIKNNSMIGDVNKFQASNDPISPPKNPMGTSDAICAPTNPFGMN